MTTEEIQIQLDAIRKSGEAAMVSKEASLKFLIEAGIIKPKKEKKTANKSQQAQAQT